jgi:hypothetical protein
MGQVGADVSASVSAAIFPGQVWTRYQCLEGSSLPEVKSPSVEFLPAKLPARGRYCGLFGLGHFVQAGLLQPRDLRGAAMAAPDVSGNLD